MAVPEPARRKVGLFPTQVIFVPSGSPMGGRFVIGSQFCLFGGLLLAEGTILVLEAPVGQTGYSGTKRSYYCLAKGVCRKTSDEITTRSWLEKKKQVHPRKRMPCLGSFRGKPRPDVHPQEMSRTSECGHQMMWSHQQRSESPTSSLPPQRPGDGRPPQSDLARRKCGLGLG